MFGAGLMPAPPVWPECGTPAAVQPGPPVRGTGESPGHPAGCQATYPAIIVRGSGQERARNQ
jgi:hypothetical protein